LAIRRGGSSRSAHQLAQTEKFPAARRLPAQDLLLPRAKVKIGVTNSPHKRVLCASTTWLTEPPFSATPRHRADNLPVRGVSSRTDVGAEAWVRATTPANRPRRSLRPGAAQALSAVAGLGVCAGAPGGALPATSRDAASAARIARIASGSSTVAISRSRLPQRGHARMSTSKARRVSAAFRRAQAPPGEQVMRAHQPQDALTAAGQAPMRQPRASCDTLRPGTASPRRGLGIAVRRFGSGLAPPRGTAAAGGVVRQTVERGTLKTAQIILSGYSRPVPGLMRLLIAAGSSTRP